jgi:hypothetical protein
MKVIDEVGGFEVYYQKPWNDLTANSMKTNTSLKPCCGSTFSVKKTLLQAFQQQQLSLIFFLLLI